MSASVTAAGTQNRVRLRLAPPVRKALVVLHVVTSVALLGELWGLVVLNLTAVLTAEDQVAYVAYRLMQRLIFAGGAPLSLTALATGVVVALASPWGLLRHYWVFAKLVLLVGVVLSGMLFFTPEDLAAATRDGTRPTSWQWQQVAVVAAGVVMLVASTALAVVKPRGRLPWART